LDRRLHPGQPVDAARPAPRLRPLPPASDRRRGGDPPSEATVPCTLGTPGRRSAVNNKKGKGGEDGVSNGEWIGVKSVVGPEVENGFDTDFCCGGNPCGRAVPIRLKSTRHLVWPCLVFLPDLDGLLGQQPGQGKLALLRRQGQLLVEEPVVEL